MSTGEPTVAITPVLMREMTAAAIRWRHLVTDNGQNHAPTPEVEPGSRWLTTGQVAQSLGISTRAVRHRIASGHLPARKAGHVYLIDPADVDGRRTA